MNRKEHLYEIYFYSEPHFFVLENDEIIDVNMHSLDREPNYRFSQKNYGPDKENYYLDITYQDYFFEQNLINSKKEDFLVIIQNFSSKTGFFLHQIQIQGDVISSGRKDGSNYIRLVYDQMITNDLGNLPPKFSPATIVYKQERASYFRDKKIDALLNKSR